MVLETIFSVIVLVGCLYAVSWFMIDFDKACKKMEEDFEKENNGDDK